MDSFSFLLLYDFDQCSANQLLPTKFGRFFQYWTIEVNREKLLDD